MIRESWLEPISPESPCGPDLAYDGDFLALEAAARGKEEQQYGDTVIPAQAPVWPDVLQRAEALLDRTRDLRVVHLYARALTCTQGLAGTAEAVGLARDLLEKFWETVHPTLSVDGEPDPIMRMNVLAAFADAQGLLRDIRAAHFLRTATTAVSVRDVERILDRSVAASETGVGVEELRASIAGLVATEPQALRETIAILDAVRAIRSTILAYLEPTLLPDFAPLVDLLKPMASMVQEVRETMAAQPSEDEAGTGAKSPAHAAMSSGEIRSREDVMRVLDRVCEFLGRNEPTNPAPLLIRRAQRIMSMPFVDIIRDLAPDAMGQVQTITGAKSET